MAIIEIVLLLLLTVVNGVFAMSELAVVSARKVRLQQLADAGDKRARVALELANSPNRFLSTVQIGITLVGIFTGAFGGATLAEELAGVLATVPAIAPYAEAIGLAIVVAAITYLSLVIGELVPKQIALNNAEGIASMVAPFMRSLSRIASPLVTLLSASSALLARLLGVRKSGEPIVTDEEIKILMRQGAELGVFEQTEHQVVERLFRLSDRTVYTLMTPRTEITWLDPSDSPEALRSKITSSRRSHFPVASGDLDNVIGIVRAKDLLDQNLRTGAIDVKAAMQPPQFVPETMPALDLLEKFRQSHAQTALVIDEYGGLQGIVRLTDIIEAIIGDLAQPGNDAEPSVVQREDGSWLVDGKLSIDEFKALINVKSFPDEEQGSYQTLGGLIMFLLGRIPTAGDQFNWGGYRFEVMDMDGRRVDRVLISRLPAEGN